MKPRVSVGLSVLIALFGAITLATAPQLHERLHPTGLQHECAATIIAAGNYEHSVAPPVLANLPLVPIVSAFLLRPLDCVVAAVPSSVLEHGPPDLS